MNSMIKTLIENASIEDLRKILMNIDERYIAQALAFELNIPLAACAGSSSELELDCHLEMAALVRENTGCKLHPNILANFYYMIKHINSSKDKVFAVKFLREHTGCGLKQALDTVNHLHHNWNEYK